MRAHLKYLSYVLRHKWYVFVACLSYGLIWRGIIHDWTKFLPCEWFPYVDYFYGQKPTDMGATGYNHQVNQDDTAFNRAWNHHQKANSHHWQYWLLTYDNPKPRFWEQSYDDGMTHTILADKDGKVAAVLYDCNSKMKWLKEPDVDARKRLLAELRQTVVPLKMPLADAKEMVADWRGAGKAQGRPKTWEWYAANKDKIILHPETRAWVEAELEAQKERWIRSERFHQIGT